MNIYEQSVGNFCCKARWITPETNMKNNKVMILKYHTFIMKLLMDIQIDKIYERDKAFLTSSLRTQVYINLKKTCINGPREAIAHF
jgi:hypothetical protein